jgi:GH25 family lysozyme M1 (1,4-beta-N-acetylmuramidase)
MISTPLLGLDDSHYQGEPDYSAFAAHGGSFVFSKGTEATSYVDPELTYNRTHVLAADLIFGTYHFARLGNPVAEAEYYLQHVQPQRGELMALDMEVEAAGVDIAAWSAQWLQHVKDATGTPPLLYLNRHLLGKYDWHAVLAENVGLWLAVYDFSETTVPASGIWPTLAFKQFSDLGNQSGVNGSVDEDAFEGDLAALKKYTIGGGAPTPAPAPAPAPRPRPTPPPPPPPPPPHPPVLRWNLGRGQFYGNMTGPAASHGGYYAWERPFVRNIQQWTIFHDCADGQAPGSWAHNGWADGKWQHPTDTAVANWHQRFYPGQPQPCEIWADDYARLARP